MTKDTIIKARVLKWGNSYGLRIQKADAKRLGLRPGEETLIRLERKGGQVDLSVLPRFKGGAPDDSLRHDELLGEARQKEKK